MELSIHELVKTSHFVGIYPDLVQGGGGNNSVKIDSERMLIKASGIELKNVSTEAGIVMVNYRAISDLFYEKSTRSTITGINNDLQEYTILDEKCSPTLRPSIEAGFHSLLDKYVIHTHSVYANILGCSVEGESIFKRIMSELNIDTAWVSYATPGAELTCIMAKYSLVFPNRKFPNVIILANHGLIIHSDDYNEIFLLSEMINKILRNYFSIIDNYPDVRISKISEGAYKSDTSYIKDFLISHSVLDRVIFPDQMVYFDNSISYDTQLKKINIDLKKKTINYHCTEREAIAIEETIVAYLYIIAHIEKNNLTLKTISSQNIETIINMDSEKYRLNLLNNSNK